MEEKENVKLEVYILDVKEQQEVSVLTVDFQDKQLYQEDIVSIKNRIGQALNTIYPIETTINYRIHRPGRQAATGYFKRYVPNQNGPTSTIGDTLAAKEARDAQVQATPPAKKSK